MHILNQIKITDLIIYRIWGIELSYENIRINVLKDFLKFRIILFLHCHIIDEKTLKQKCKSIGKTLTVHIEKVLILTRTLWF